MREKLKVAILGGGFTGMTAAYDLAKAGHQVTLFEKAEVLGGLAVGFREPHWDWPLERAYHHLFANDTDIISFVSEIGFNKIFFNSPRTDSLYKEGRNYRIIPVDSPQGFLQFPYLSPREKLQAGIILALLKFLPCLPLYEHMTAEDFSRKYMGEAMWNKFFKELFRKKYGKYAGNILASFLWARIHKRTKKLGYVEGGFQSLIDYIGSALEQLGVILELGTAVGGIRRQENHFIINGEKFDRVISTLPSPILAMTAAKVLPQNYLNRFSKLQYLHALVLILETDKPLLDGTYWLNIVTPEIPIMFIGQHTNFVDKKHYGGNHIAYIGYYLERDDPLMAMTAAQLFKHLQPHLKKIIKKQYKVINTYLFHGPFAQPIFDKDFVKNKPDFKTPVDGFYIANLDMTYPYDRGTNYAVKLGREVAELLIQET